MGAVLCRAPQVGELETRRDVPRGANAHAEDAPIPLSDAGGGPCGVGTRGRELAAGLYRALGRGLLAGTAPGEPEAMGAGGGTGTGTGTASSPGPCRLGVGVCSGRRADGALWAGAGGQTVNTAKQASLSAALLAARREKITPGKRRGCGAGGAGCHWGTQPACHPGYFSTRSWGWSGAGDGRRGASGEGERPPFSLVPPGRWGGERRGGTAENRLLRVGFFGRAASGAGPLGAPRMRSVGTAVPVPRLSLHHSWISGDGDPVHPAALGELPPLAPGFASS